MRISDWSSDVCSSDLAGPVSRNPVFNFYHDRPAAVGNVEFDFRIGQIEARLLGRGEIGKLEPAPDERRQQGRSSRNSDRFAHAPGFGSLSPNPAAAGKPARDPRLEGGRDTARHQPGGTRLTPGGEDGDQTT